MLALWSDIAVWDSLTINAVAPIVAAACSGLRSNPANSRSTRGRGIIVRVGVGDDALLIE